jgi:ankyrin repeat protein
LTGGFPWNRGGLLTIAAKFGQLDSTRCLLDLGLNPDEPTLLGDNEGEAWSWGGPLWHAAEYGEFKIAELLLDRGADPSANVYASGWPLDRAYLRGDRAMIDLLYERGAKPAVYTVCSAHDLDAAKRILDAEGDDPEVVREMVWSAACCTGLPIIKLALPRLALEANDERWHDLLRQPMRHDEPPEHLRPAGYEYDWRFIILQMMLDKGANPNVPSRFGLTLLQFAAARRHTRESDAARFATQLLNAGADPSLRDELLRSTALGWACRYGNAVMVDTLIERGVPVNEPDAEPWATPLAWAKKMGHTAIAERLRAAGAKG